jgi:acetyl-CoA carboxylase biotin carboxyl carrier protein
MDLDQIRELLKIVAESSVAEVEIVEDDFKLVVRKHATTVTVQQPQAYPPLPYLPPAYPPPPANAPPLPPPYPPVVAPPNPAETNNSAQAPPAEAANTETVHAPIVGTFYRASSPGADPFVEVGDTVNTGDVLCIIEAMKLMNEIESEVSGKVKQILVGDATPVEYDQPLFVIEKA